MIKFLISILIYFFLFFTSVLAEVITEIEVKNNNRISKETIITYGQIELGKDYDLNAVNEVFRNLYQTNFFEELRIDIKDKKLVIEVVENKIIQNVVVEGIKSTKTRESILENLFSKDKSPFLITKVKEDVDRIKVSLNSIGYYFADVETKTVENTNNTIDLFFNINLGDKAKISQIEFIGDKKVKDRTLRNIIISEEKKFWKFISKKKYLNKSIIERDKRLLKNFYLDKGYYDVEISSSTVEYFDDTSFKLTYRIDAGVTYTINSASLNLPDNYDVKNFENINKLLKKLEKKDYSFNRVAKVVDEIDKVSLSREFEFINAEVIENKLGKDKLDIIFKIKESDQFYVERINILGNNVTHENVIRNALEIDEGDPFNELLNAKSINKLRSLNIFGKVNIEVQDGETDNTKILEVQVDEKPTGNISLGAGFGTEGGTIGFAVSENNFLGKNIKLNANLRTSADTIKGSFAVTNPNFNYSNKALITNIENTSIDKMADNGYKTNKTGFSIGTRYEQYQDTFFSPSLVTEIEDLTTSSLASDSLKKQSGNYFENKFNYALDFDKRDKRYQTTEGSRTILRQGIPLISDEYALLNSLQSERWFKFKNEMVTNFGFFGSTINSMNDEDVRVTDRLTLPRKNLKGFKFGAFGPVDNDDYVGGNYAVSVNFDTTLPMILPGTETIDFKYFVDIGNVWGVDYSDTIDDSNKIRSSTGITVDWWTPIGPLNFSLAQNLSKATTDQTESFQFNLGTTF